MVASYTFQNLLPAETFGNINLHQLTQFLIKMYDFRIEISFMEKQKNFKKIPFRYVFSIAINVFL